MELYDTKTEKVVWSERWQKNWIELPQIRDLLAENILEKLKDHFVSKWCDAEIDEDTQVTWSYPK